MFFYHFSTIPIWHKRIASILLSSHCHFVGKLISQRHLTVIEKMPVYIAGHGDVCVSEPLLNILEGKAHINEDAGTAMAQIVKSYLRQIVFAQYS